MNIHVAERTSRIDDSIPAPIVLVCSADDNYAMPLTVVLYSAIANLSNPQQTILAFILDGGIKEASKQKITQSLKSDRIEIRWVQPNLARLDHLPVSRYLTRAAYCRLLIPQLIPESLSKAIYLDCDMVVQGDLEQLWQIEMGDNYVLAVQDDNQSKVSMAAGLRNYRDLGLNPNQKYFNSGLLVINLQKWLADNIGEKVIQFSETNQDYIMDADQDGLNAVFAGQWGELDSRWNQMPRIYDYASWQDSPFDPETYEARLHQPHVIHYTNAPKPWKLGCVHPATDLFFHYFNQTAWAGWQSVVYALWMKPYRLLGLRPFQRIRNGMKLAVLMYRTGLDRQASRRILVEHYYNLRQAMTAMQINATHQMNKT